MGLLEWFQCSIPRQNITMTTLIDRAQGCLLGQLSGDALGSLVEFMTPEVIKKAYPDGVRTMTNGGTWDTIAGQPTDDSEMALMLAKSLLEQGTYHPDAALDAYRFWIGSQPFDCGATISAGLHGMPNTDSQANGAMMRISPLGIFGATHDLAQVAEWAREDAMLTHPNPVCVQANVLFTMAISHAIQWGTEPEILYGEIGKWAVDMGVESSLANVIESSATNPPDDYVYQQGWVLIAFGNALWQLLHAENLEEGVVDTVMRGGDTDTNAAICGALLGAVYGRDAVPDHWVQTLLNCRPETGKPGVKRPRPECFWPVDALDLAEQLVLINRG